MVVIVFSLCCATAFAMSLADASCCLFFSSACSLAFSSSSLFFSSAFSCSFSLAWFFFFSACCFASSSLFFTAAILFASCSFFFFSSSFCLSVILSLPTFCVSICFAVVAACSLGFASLLSSCPFIVGVGGVFFSFLPVVGLSLTALFSMLYLDKSTSPLRMGSFVSPMPCCGL